MFHHLSKGMTQDLNEHIEQKRNEIKQTNKKPNHSTSHTHTYTQSEKSNPELS